MSVEDLASAVSNGSSVPLEVGRVLTGDLPSAEFKDASSDEEELFSWSGDDLSIFSRSQHIKSLGLHSESDLLDLESDLLDLESDVLNLESNDYKIEGSNFELSSDEGMGSTQKSIVSTNKSHVADESNYISKLSWDDFKTQFNDTLKIAEEKVTADQFHRQEVISAASSAKIQQDLIEIITSLHSSSDIPPSDVSGESMQEGCASGSKNSPTKHRRQLLSLSTLETIEESEIDRALEIVENDQSGLEIVENDQSGAHGSNIDPTHSNASNPAGNTVSPRPEFIWNVKGNPSSCYGDGSELMDQLRQLSETQANSLTRDKDESTCIVKDLPVNASPKRIEEPTVFIDLRKNKDGKASAGSNTYQRLDSSDSDDDDPYSWVLRRRKIKGDMEASTSHLILSSTSSSSKGDKGSSTCHHSFSSSEDNQDPSISHLTLTSSTSSSSRGNQELPNSHLTLTSSTSTSSGERNQEASTLHPTLSPSTSLSGSTTHPSHNLHLTQKASLPATKPECEMKKPHEENINEKEMVTRRANREIPEPLCNIGTNSHTERLRHDDSKVEPKSCSITTSKRQRSSDSLTLSSSVSDGEVASSDETGIQIKDPSSPKGTKSKKKPKKSKKSKSRKKEDPQPRQSTERSSSSQKRRAYVLQRIRSDSLNTSSDEEHSLTSSITNTTSPDSVVNMGTSGDQSDGKGNKIVQDTEKMKVYLQKRILSKKPPAPFETPATDPIFHEDISFSKQMMDNNPLATPSGILVLSVLQHGLTTLPSPWTDLDVDIQILLHCLLLTWLTCQASSDFNNLISLKSRSPVDKSEASADRSEAFPDSRLPFFITGIQQTILDGQLSILVAVQEKSSCDLEQGDPFNSSSETNMIHDDQDENEIENFLSSVSLETVLQPLLSNTSISDSISLASLSTLGPLLLEPMSSFFTFQEDTSPLNTPISFYWHSLYHPSCLPSNESLRSQDRLSTTVCTLNHASLNNLFLVFSVFQRVFSNGLDVAGVRLLYREHDASISYIKFLDTCSDPSKSSMMLALALRGPDAIFNWVGVVGPEDNVLAKVTDPLSITAQFGSGVINTVRTPYRYTAALAKWFGGRACLKTGTVFGMSDPHTKSERRKRQRVRFSESESEDSISSPLPDVIFPPLISNRPRLIVQPYTKSLLVISPNIPPSCYGSVLASCSKLGFDIFGAKRIRLNSKRASILDIPSEFVSHFTPSSTPPSPANMDFSTHPLQTGGVFVQSLPPLPSVIFIIGRENSSVHRTSLRKLIATNLKSLVDCNRHIEFQKDLVGHPNALIHLAPHTEEKLKTLGAFTAPISNGNSQPKPEEISETKDNILQEELCFVAVPGVNSLFLSISLLNNIFNIVQENSLIDKIGKDKQTMGSLMSTEEVNTYDQFEMVGMKIVPQLVRFHAKKICPLEAKDPLYAQAVQLLSDKPVSLFVFRGISCNQRIRAYIKIMQGSTHMVSLEQKLQFIVSSGFVDGINLSSWLFSGKDLFTDARTRTLAPYLPNAWIHESDIFQSFLGAQENMFSVLQLPLSQMQQAIKILGKLSRSGFMFAGLSMVDLALKSKSILEDLENDEQNDSCLGKPGIVVCVEKVNCVWYLDHLVCPFIGENHRNSHLKCSKNFNSAISDLKWFFPDGIHTKENSSLVKDYNIKLLTKDIFSDLLLPEEHRKLKPVPSSTATYISPLLERTVIILPSSLLTQQEKKPATLGFIHVLDFLHRSKFEICGMKMILFSEDSVREIRIILSLDVKLENITCVPSVVMVLERDNGASCFHSIVKSTFPGQDEDVCWALSEIIAPSNLKEAKQLLSYFCIGNY